VYVRDTFEPGFSSNPVSGSREAMSQMNLSARAYHRILKLARAIADPADAL
jgi:predicted ATPase with chaperone activity